MYSFTVIAAKYHDIPLTSQIVQQSSVPVCM